jgi:hypothetical protein
MIVMIRISGQVNMTGSVVTILNELHIKKKFSCILTKEDDVRIFKVKDHVAYGVFDEKLMDKLKKRSKGEYFALHPPIGGFKKSSKLAFPRGILGNHGKEINKLLERML